MTFTAKVEDGKVVLPPEVKLPTGTTVLPLPKWTESNVNKSVNGRATDVRLIPSRYAANFSCPRYWVGDWPVIFLKTRLKCVRD